MKTAIITDTNSGISPEEGKTLGIYVVPMPVIVDEQDYLEHVDITHEALYEAILAGKDVRTSQPSPDLLLKCWDEALKDGFDKVVYVPMSSGLSNSCEIAQSFAKEYEGRVLVADSHRISVTLRDSVIEAKAMADRGEDAEAIHAHLEAEGGHSSIYIAVDSLTLLKKSGRVTAAGAAIAATFGIKPLLTIQGGKLDAFAKVRGMRNCMSRICDALDADIKNRFADVPAEQLSIGAAGTFVNAADADTWLSMMRERFPKSHTYYNPLSCSIACHVSVNSIGAGVTAPVRI